MDIYYPADLYADTRTTCIALFRSLSAEQSVTVVPLNPEWRVVDVAAHVCGIVDDVLHGNVAGLGSDAWTEAQVAKRAGMSLSEVCDEWEGYAERVDAITADTPYFGVRITGDLVLHLQDVQHALGFDIDGGDLATRLGAHRYVPSLQERATEQIKLGVAVELTDGKTYPAPDSASEIIALRCTSYDFLRSVTGRRSRRQVEALDWDGDSTALLNSAWNTYGDMRTDDVSA
ncbi:MAG: hypothetical protein ACKVK3_13070 [Acidimicrobiales bacterium]|jgi:hypothetical protein